MQVPETISAVEHSATPINTEKVCLRCGSCLAACPVYKKELTEMVTPRGKMALAEAVSEGELDARRDVASYLSKCLVCTACMDECPNNLDVDVRMIAARSSLANQKVSNLPFFAAFRTVLQTRSLMDLMVFFSRAFRRLIFFRVPGESGLHLRFPLAVPRDRLLPPIAKRSFFKSPAAKKAQAQAGTTSGSVAYFVGCMGNYSCTNVPEHLLRLVAGSKVHVSVPLDQRCCGMPAVVAGDLKSARRLARRNIEVLLATGAERILTTCGSCGSTLKHYYPTLFVDEPDTRSRAEDLASRVVDVSQLLVDVLHRGKFKVNKALLTRLGLDASRPVKVTYHDSCHLARRMGVVGQPRAILDNIEGVEFVPMKDADVCCGCGGLFSVHHYDLSSSITADKIRNILATGADIVATGCPACMMQIADGLAHAGRNIPVVHTIELLG